MRHVEIHAFIKGLDTDTVFDTLADFSHYAELVNVVRSVEMERTKDGITSSKWVVEFRNGLLQWTEENWFCRDQLRLDFKQIEGDFEQFYGGWVLAREADGVKAALVADFDFGVPSLASIVEPVAARVLTEVTEQVLLGLFGDRVNLRKRTVPPGRETVEARAIPGRTDHTAELSPPRTTLPNQGGSRS
jgi:ribosome-associated toxin RatA of RatAB toxin-antitoxin module